jgi:hypothetical protein
MAVLARFEELGDFVLESLILFCTLIPFDSLTVLLWYEPLKECSCVHKDHSWRFGVSLQSLSIQNA